MYDKISTSIDNNDYCIGIFVDLSKAFDTLNHQILINKLMFYGVRGLPLKWFKSYLENRQQYVYYNNASSSLMPILCGVPQGSILGPLLFILYINDIINCSKIIHFILFADDTNLFFSGRDYCRLIDTVNMELSKLSKWFMANKLSMNIKKTNFIIFGNKFIPCTPKDLNIDGLILERVKTTKFLGVYLDEKLNWNHHIHHISVKIAKGLGMLNRVKSFLPRNILLMVYSTLIKPFLSYCCILWGGASVTSLNKIHVLQKRALRIITKSPLRAPSNPLFVALNLLHIYDIYKLQVSLFMYNVKHRLLPFSCLRYCVENTLKYHATRSVSYFTLINFRTNIRKRSIAVYGPRLWSLLPVAIQESLNVYSFKKMVTTYFHTNYTHC